MLDLLAITRARRHTIILLEWCDAFQNPEANDTFGAVMLLLRPRSSLVHCVPERWMRDVVMVTDMDSAVTIRLARLAVTERQLCS